MDGCKCTVKMRRGEAHGPYHRPYQSPSFVCQFNELNGFSGSRVATDGGTAGIAVDIIDDVIGWRLLVNC